MMIVPTMPNAKQVQAALSNLEDGFLAPFESKHIGLSRNMYDELLMPWNIVPPVSEFPKDNSVRHEWNRHGHLEQGEEDFFGGSHEYTLLKLEQTLGCASMVTKWR